MDLTVYSAAWCPDCREAKRFLAKHNIAFQEVDVESTPGAIDEIVKRTGKRAIPQFVIDGEWVQPYRPGQGFLYEEMTVRLGLNSRIYTAASEPAGPVAAFPARLRPRRRGSRHTRSCFVSRSHDRLRACSMSSSPIRQVTV